MLIPQNRHESFPLKDVLQAVSSVHAYCQVGKPVGKDPFAPPCQVDSASSKRLLTFKESPKVTDTEILLPTPPEQSSVDL